MSDDLNDDEYLWSGTGTPDPDVARLESLLGRYRHQGTPPPLPDRVVRRRLLPIALTALTAAASLVLIAAAAWYGVMFRTTAWTVQSIEGTPRVAGAPVGRHLQTDLLRSEPALYENQFNMFGFEWVDLRHREESGVGDAERREQDLRRRRSGADRDAERLPPGGCRHGDV